MSLTCLIKCALLDCNFNDDVDVLPRGTGNLNMECTVLPPFNEGAAIPD